MPSSSRLLIGAAAGAATAALLIGVRLTQSETPAPSRDLTLATQTVAPDHALEAAERGLSAPSARGGRVGLMPAPLPAEPDAPPAPAPAPADLAALAPVSVPAPQLEPVAVATTSLPAEEFVPAPASAGGMGVMSLSPGATVSAVPAVSGGDLPVTQASWPSKLGAMDRGQTPLPGSAGRGDRCGGRGMPTGLVLR